MSLGLPRRRVTRFDAPRYPDLRSFLRVARCAVVGVGVVTVAMSTAACTEVADSGEPEHYDSGHYDSGHYESTTYWTNGDVEVPVEYETVGLPETGVRELVFPDGLGVVGYRIDVLVEEGSTQRWLEERVDEALEVIDEVLLQYKPDVLVGGHSLDSLELEIQAALLLLYTDELDIETDDIAEVQLTVNAIPAR